MHVSPRRVQPAPTIPPTPPPGPPPPPPAAPVPGDSVSISEEARALAKARQVVESAPDVRAAKVAAVKQRLADGTYEVPADDLARAMLRDKS